tara:strand:- start:114 stop:689 length:576 start_codon:yes stop_codon:yes gene_type:complete
MNLAFKFNDDLFWIHNFLPRDVYTEMYRSLIRLRNNDSFKESAYNWNTFKEEEENRSYSVNQDRINNMPYFTQYHILLKHNPFVDLKHKVLNSHLRKFVYGSHLAWHEDTEETDVSNNTRAYAATFYFNKTWGESWGGELMFKSNKGSGFIPVIGNSVVIVKTGLKHKVNAVLKKTHPRLSIQTWIDKDET